MKRKKAFVSGVTIIELLLVVSIVAVLAVPAASIGSSFFTRNNLKNNVNEVVSSLRTAQINAISGRSDSSWGVNVSSGQIILFKGNSYATRDPAFDQKFLISKSISITNFEVVFSKISGNTSATQSIIVANDIGESKSISVNEVGTVDVN